MGYSSEDLGHLGLVSAMCEELEIAETIDHLLGPSRRQVSVGEAVVAMVLNGLGFVSKPLYLSPEFFENKPVSLLVAPHLCADDLSQFSEFLARTRVCCLNRRRM